MKYLVTLFLFAATCFAQTLHVECDIKGLPDAEGKPTKYCAGNFSTQRLMSIGEGSLSFEWSGKILFARYSGHNRNGMPDHEQDSFSVVRDEHGNPVPWSKLKTLCVTTGFLEGKSGNGTGLFACGQVPPRSKETKSPQSAPQLGEPATPPE